MFDRLKGVFSKKKKHSETDQNEEAKKYMDSEANGTSSASSLSASEK